METESYTIKTTSFEGPFSLLLSLIEKRKLFINDLSLAEVTDDYLRYINTLSNVDPSEVSSFIVVASTLLLIKSKSLLPNLELTDEEKGDIADLEERLRLYEIYNKQVQKIKNNFGKNIIFPPVYRKNDVLVFLPDDRITKDSMMTLAKGVLGSMPKKVFLPNVEVKKVISIEEMIDSLTSRIQSSLKMNFRDFAGAGKTVTKEDKVVVIVGFLAMLELVRQGLIHAMQGSNFEDIVLEKREEEKELTENLE